ncbi:MAG: 6-pyruvoyltetrahydropterin/6-carboxytetrahydropterin synthase [Campylobacterota bacterium]|nr:6-pyruvoyltetrahydropterin/6-carboxytetrahydropterin synthase [Campylobacterota bacterium]
MIIRKLFKFENAHIVRNCHTDRCKFSIHGHSYKVEVLLESNFLDNAQMVVDFGLVKEYIKDIIDSFDHSIAIWNKDSKEYIEDIKKHSLRWVELPVSPSAEQFSRVIFKMVDTILKNKEFRNGEKNVSVKSIIVHETDTGYAQCFKEDVENPQMGLINLNEIVFSPQIKSEWKNNIKLD